MKRTWSKNDKEVDQHVVFVTVDQSNLWGWTVAGWKLLIYCHNYQQEFRVQTSANSRSRRMIHKFQSIICIKYYKSYLMYLYIDCFTLKRFNTVLDMVTTPHFRELPYNHIES